VGEWSARWLETKVDLKATTRRSHEVTLRVHVIPTWGAVKRIDVSHELLPPGWLGLPGWATRLTEAAAAIARDLTAV